MRRLFIGIFLLGSGAFGARVVAQAPAPSAQTWTIDAVLTAALAQHPLVEAARAQLSAAEGMRQTAGNLPNPIATYWFENVPFSSRTSTLLDPESNIYGTLPLEPFLQRGSRIGQASNEIRVAQASVTMAQQSVAADAVRAFYRVALGQSAVEAARDNLAAIEDVVVYLRNRVAQGAAPEGDLIRAEVERDRAAADVTMADVDLIRAQAALRPFLGGAAPVETLRVLPPTWPSQPTTLAPVTEFTTHALAQRADIVAARARTDAASNALALERSLVVRQLGASFGIKRTSGVTAMEGGLSLTVPLFDHNRGEIQRATGEHLAAEFATRWLERVIASEVEAEYQVAERLTSQVASLQASFLNRAEESRRIALATYQEGATTLLQVLDASRTLSEARVMFARVVTAANQSLFDLAITAGYDARSAAQLGRGPAGSPSLNSQGGWR